MILFGNQQNRSKLVTYGNGLLYNWYAVNGDSESGSKVFAPSGWHVPTGAEFTTLANALGGVSVAGGKMKSTRTSAPYFASPNTGADDSSGFRAFGSGYRYIDGSFLNPNAIGAFWTSTVRDTNNRFLYALSKDNATLTSAYGVMIRGYSIRFIKDDSTWIAGMVVTDLDGNKYPTVKIGNQVWLKSNWKCTKYNDGTPIPNVTVAGTWAGLTTGAYCSYLNQPIVEYTELF